MEKETGARNLNARKLSRMKRSAGEAVQSLSSEGDEEHVLNGESMMVMDRVCPLHSEELRDRLSQQLQEVQGLQEEDDHPESDQPLMEGYYKEDRLSEGFARSAMRELALEKQIDARATDVPLESEGTEEDSNAHFAKSMFAKEISGIGMPSEETATFTNCEANDGSDCFSVPNNSGSTIIRLRNLVDFDRVFWPDSPRTFTSRDILSKVEEIAEEIYEEALAMQETLSSRRDSTGTVAGSEEPEEGHGSESETKETCGAITYMSNTKGPSRESERVGVESSQRLEQHPTNSNDLSASIPASQILSLHRYREDDIQILENNMVSNDFDRAKSGMDSSQVCGSGSTQEAGLDKSRTIKQAGGLADTKRASNDRGDLAEDALMMELLRLQESNARKQAKIDSLQKWKKYYSAEIQKRDEKMQKQKLYAGELKKKEMELRDFEQIILKNIELKDAEKTKVQAEMAAEIQELTEVVRDLTRQITTMEELLPVEGIPRGCYPDPDREPCPKTLLSAVVGVKEAAVGFTRTFMSYLKQHPDKGKELEDDILMESGVVARPADFKFLVQAFICRRMFLNFESECFSIESCMAAIWDEEELAKICFQEFQSFRRNTEAVTKVIDNRANSPFLREFCFKKFLSIVGETTEVAFFGDLQHSEDIFSGRHPRTRFYESFCKLAVSVWLLHRLAFSFVPPARMIPVPRGAKFDPSFMDSAVPGMFDDDDEGHSFQATVGLMVLPGFRVGKSIIKAQIYLVQ